MRAGIYDLVQRPRQRAALLMPSIAGKQVSPHIIRHTTATYLLRAGVDINPIRGWLRVVKYYQQLCGDRPGDERESVVGTEPRDQT